MVMQQPQPAAGAAMFPEMGPVGSMPQDASILTEVLRARDAKLRRKERPPGENQMSVLTAAAVQLQNILSAMREEFKAAAPAPFMKAQQSRRKARSRFLAMSREEHVMLARRVGVQRYAMLAKQLGFDVTKPLPIGGTPDATR